MTIDFSKLKIADERPIVSFNFTYNLMRSFIKHAEETVQKSIDEFKTNGPETFEIEICAEDNIYQHVEHYMGLDNADVDLAEIFTLYFPSLQRRSSFLTLFGTYEHEIEKFCINFAKREQTYISLSDTKYKGLERSHLFIKKVVGLTDSAVFIELKKIIVLRNACTHNDARFINNDGKEIIQITQLIDSVPILLAKENNEVLFKNGFLLHVLNLFDSYIKEIEAVIKSKGK
jgi:hypothetical protein